MGRFYFQTNSKISYDILLIEAGSATEANDLWWEGGGRVVAKVINEPANDICGAMGENALSPDQHEFDFPEE